MGGRSVKHVVLIFFVLSGMFSCTNSLPDESLSVDEYVRLGMPDPGKPWEMADYTQAYNVLAKIKWEKPHQLPAKDSKKSGLLFDHMMSLEYLSFLQDTSSLNEKAARISEFMRVYDNWIDIYTVPIIKENRYHREILEIQIFNLRLMEAMVNLAHKINRSDDPADVALQVGYNSIKENYFASLDNNFKMQRNTSAFLKRDLDRMADSVYASVLRNKEWIDSSDVNELHRSLRLVIDSTSSDYIRSKYKNLEESLKGT